MDRWSWIFIAFIFSVIGTLGSLFFSEVMNFPPCALCWYQRIALYPLCAVFAVGFLTKDENVTRYAWPMVGIGLFIALYHNLLYYGVIPETLSPCTEGLSCKTAQLEAFGFVTIPMLAFMGFASIAATLVLFRKRA